jgi:hypothetical protein
MALMTLIGAGCSESVQEHRAASSAAMPAPAAGEAAPALETQDGGGGAGAVPEGLPRKIIYTAEVALSVEDFGAVADQIARLVGQYGGYIAESDTQGRPGAGRSGRWKARVPVERFDAFVEAVVALGELERRKTDSQDVTEEFYDLEARIKNKTVEEQRLIEHLKNTTGELKEILEVEKELSRVREEVERLQGRLRLLANLTSLTTVSISVHERQRYTPAQSPTFGERIVRRFRGSSDQLVRAGQEFLLASVSVVPWLPIWLIAGLVAWLVFRRIQARSRRPVPGRPDA